MLIPAPRVFCLRPVAGAAAAASILSAGAASTPCLLPALALAQACRPPPAGPASPSPPPSCICAIHAHPSAQQRCHVHHRPSACAASASSSSAGASTSAPLAGPRPRPRGPQLPPASFPFLPPFSTAAPFSASSSAAFPSSSSSSSLHSMKRRRTATHATAGGAASEPPAAAASEPASVDPGAAPPQPLPPSGLGQVIASASNYVRVEVYHLLYDTEPTPPHWRPPHLRPRPEPQTAAAAEQPPPAAAAAAAAAAEPPSPPPEAAQAPAPRPRLLLCSVRSLLRKLRQDVVVGDVVRVGSIDWAQGRGVVTEVLPRSSRLVDPSVANVDHVLLVFALDQPPFEELQVSRFLVAAEAAELPFSLVLNKADLVPEEELERRLEQCRSWGYEPIVLSCERGEGVEQVAEVLEGRISVVAGPSGAGKSSLINSLRLGRHRPDLRDNSSGDPRVGDEPEPTAAAAAADLIELPAAIVEAYGGNGDGSAAASFSDGDGGSGGEEGEEAEEVEAQVGAGRRGRSQRARRGGGGGRDAGSSSSAEGSEADADPAAAAPEFLAVGSLSRIGRGMHTTTAVTLLRLLGGGWLADTPGFGQPTLDDIPSQSLDRTFPEITALLAATPCRFSDCRHLAEPGCAVRDAGLERYPHYTRFLREIRVRESDDVRQLQRAKAEREGATKAKSVRGGGERQEARLDPRRHRRQSRQSARRAGQQEEEELLG